MDNQTLIWKTVCRLILASILLVVLSGCFSLKQADFSRLPASELSKEVKTARNALEPRFPSKPRTVHFLPDLPLVVNKEVEAEINHYRKKDPRYIPLAHRRRSKYAPMINQVLADEGIPQTISNVALVESGFKNNIKSRAGAAGIWQFMKATAKYYGLRVNLLNDQRTDPILSTLAAARLLRDLYYRYEDWHLALAAYNAGPSHVNRAIKRGKTRDFWQLARKGLIYRQTRRYVAKVLAASIIEKEPLEYGFVNLVQLDMFSRYATKL